MKQNFNIYNAMNDIIMLNIKFNEECYNFFMKQTIDIQEELDYIPKIFKKTRKKLEEDLNKIERLADKHFEYYMLDCEELYDLHNGVKSSEME